MNSSLKKVFFKAEIVKPAMSTRRIFKYKDCKYLKKLSKFIGYQKWKRLTTALNSGSKKNAIRQRGSKKCDLCLTEKII